MVKTRRVLILLAFLALLALQMFPAQAYPVSGYTKIYEGIECTFADTSVGNVAVCAPTSTTIRTFHRGLSDELWMNSWTVGDSWSAWAYQGNCFH